MAPQDSFIDEDDDCCPLCVEEFDLSDKNFRPCPCGYQICQFCFNNIKNNINGLCPACRRPYDEKTIEWKVVTPEEVAQFKANIQKNAKKKQEQRQKEAQKREVESLNRKHLSGLRVVQKNLVYVVGLSPGIPEQEILQTLRGEKYFGQYGKIIKIVVSNKKQGDPGPNGSSLGIYVTFARKEDAARCIAAVNGSQNGDRVLRAQLGTTKYCSAYLRNEVCTNKNCMFLHEPGDNDDSYSRQDLSSINSVGTQRPLASIASSSGSSSRQVAQAQAPIAQVQPVAAAAQPMARDNSKDGSDISGDGSALPSSASWAKGGIAAQQRSRRGSHATSGAASSPAVSQAVPTRTASVEIPPESMHEEEPEVEPELTEQVASVSAESVEPSPTPRPTRDPVLLDLLRAINSPSLSYDKPTSFNENTSNYPPLFDEYGGEKRRAMRQMQEEARVQLDQDSQEDQQSVVEPLEEEEPESGSLQLGGEPEDRDAGRDAGISQSFLGRRPSSQLPIQRASNGGPFGPSLGQNFGPNLSNLSSINGRPLTQLQQQQLLLMKSGQPQSGFAEQYPPGMGGQPGQSGLFQQQGHNRQSSRYSFAGENPSATSVKPSANPKLMAQQSSMMPSVQQGNQFYGSAHGPPGLKSSGTPPVGGSMFGQVHGFNGMGNGFGTQKENGDMIRDMLRGRGAAGGQSHDAGKREYMFPSFLQQYPSASSTPAPPSGLLASLYGPQTGAFHDFGQKQKKKGKKHRHANTSSSGGSGLVDLADPSILQARMQHQQQSNAGVGQGLFGGQAQEDQNLPSLDDASMVDALVADTTADEFESRLHDPFGFQSRSSTPSVPPGFGLPHIHPPPLIEAPPKTVSRIVPTSAPFMPRAAVPLPRPVTPLVGPVTPPKITAAKIETSTSKARQDVKTLATNSGLSKAIASQSSAAALQAEDFPALESGKKTVTTPALARTSAPIKSVATPVLNKKTATAGYVPAVASGSNVTERPSTPLKISVPAKAAAKIVTTDSKPAPASAAFPPLPTSATMTPSIQSPLNRQPKTLRLIATPKAEFPPGTGSTPSSSVTSMFPPNIIPTRQPSLASLSRYDRPGTPTSEIISDGASIASTSLSRASSPPPTRIGSAPIRNTTKSMQKKQRREAQKEKEKAELGAAVPKVELEVEVAPIMGRKKKQKKERTTHSAAGGSTPAASRPPSPSPMEKISETKATPDISAQPSPVREKHSSVEPEKSNNKGKGKAKMQQTPPMPEPEPVVALEPEQDDEDKPILTPAAILHELFAAGLIEHPHNLPILKSPANQNRQQDSPVDVQPPNQKLQITAEDRAALLKGFPVHKVANGSRILLTPNGDCVRNLTSEEEQRYLELQERLADEAGPAAFTSSKHFVGTGFTLIGGRAVPNGPPSFFPTQSGNGTPMDPVSKIQRDEALSYINQYVLPSLSTNTQLEKALNINPLDADILRPGDASAWATWGSDAATQAPHPIHTHQSHNEAPRAGSSKDAAAHGKIATGLESMTAHFAIGGDHRGQPLGNVSLLGLGEAESAMGMARKEAEGLEKRLNALIKRNRRMLLGSGH